MVGVSKEEHVAQIQEAYYSAGINCMVLWESDVLENWNEISEKVIEWIVIGIKG